MSNPVPHSIEVHRLEEQIAGLEEKFNMESITIEMLERLVYDLSKDHVKTQYQLSDKISKMKIDHDVKINQKDDLLKSKNTRLKILQEKEKRLKKENNNLYKVIASKEVEALSMKDKLEDSEKTQ